MITYEAKIKNCKISKNVRIVKPVNLYECTIGSNTKIGPFVEIQSGAIIGSNCNIQSHSFICTLCNNWTFLFYWSWSNVY